MSCPVYLSYPDDTPETSVVPFASYCNSLQTLLRTTWNGARRETGALQPP
jgi:hypothetical protein